MARTRMTPKDHEAQRKLELVIPILQEVAINGSPMSAQEFCQWMLGVNGGNRNPLAANEHGESYGETSEVRSEGR